MFYNSRINMVLAAALVLLAIGTVYFVAFAPAEFSASFAREDGIVEYATAILLTVAGFVLVALGRRVSGYRKWLLFFYGFAFVVAAGEEISWGQRIFGIESGEFFLENNFQGETNFHNLVVGEEQLAKFWFGHFLSFVILCYLVVMPLLHPIFGWVRKFAGILAVPVAPRWVPALALIWSILSAVFELPRIWEVYECLFAILTCRIFLSPANAATFGFAPRS